MAFGHGFFVLAECSYHSAICYEYMSLYGNQFLVSFYLFHYMKMAQFIVSMDVGQHGFLQLGVNITEVAIDIYVQVSL